MPVTVASSVIRGGAVRKVAVTSAVTAKRFGDGFSGIHGQVQGQILRQIRPH